MKKKLFKRIAIILSISIFALNGTDVSAVSLSEHQETKKVTTILTDAERERVMKEIELFESRQRKNNTECPIVDEIPSEDDEQMRIWRENMEKGYQEFLEEKQEREAAIIADMPSSESMQLTKYGCMEILSENLSDLSVHEQEKVQSVIDVSETDMKQAANIINSYDDETYEVAVKKILDKCYDDIENIDHEAISEFASNIDSRSTDIIRGYEEALEERKHQSDLNYEVGKILVSFKEGMSYSQIKEIADHLGGDASTSRILDGTGRTIDKYSLSNDNSSGFPTLALLDIGIGQTVKKAKESLALIDGILDADYNYTVELEGVLDSTVNDPFVSRQAYLDQINVSDAWSSLTDSFDLCNYSEDPAVIAVIDTGVDIEHNDIKGILSKDSVTLSEKDTDGNYKSLFDCENPYYDEHGTHVAGIIGAVSNNGVGTSGITSVYDSSTKKTHNLCEILAINIATMVNGEVTMYIDKIFDALCYAFEKKVDVINMSLVWTADSLYNEYIQKAINILNTSGITVVAAAGNDSTDSVYYPSAFANVLSVAALSTDGRTMWSDSNYGPNVDFCAPGEAITSSLAGTSTYVISFSGTSMATPMVSATAGFMRAVNKDISPERIEYCLQQTADDLYTTGWDTYTGYGRVNVGYAVQMAKMYAYMNNNANEPAVDAECIRGESIKLNIEITPLSEYYIIKRAESSAGPYKIINDHVGRDALMGDGVVHFTDTNVELGKTYYYQVIDYMDAYSKENGYSIPYSRHPNGTIISVDCSLPPLTIYNYENTIRWVDDGTFIGVYIFRSTSRDGDYSIIARTNESRYIDSDVISGNTYYYKVQAYKNTSEGVWFTGFSNVISITAQ